MLNYKLNYVVQQINIIGYVSALNDTRLFFDILTIILYEKSCSQSHQQNVLILYLKQTI